MDSELAPHESLSLEDVSLLEDRRSQEPYTTRGRRRTPRNLSFESDVDTFITDYENRVKANSVNDVEGYLTQLETQKNHLSNDLTKKTNEARFLKEQLQLNEDAALCALKDVCIKRNEAEKKASALQNQFDTTQKELKSELEKHQKLQGDWESAKLEWAKEKQQLQHGQKLIETRLLTLLEGILSGDHPEVGQQIDPQTIITRLFPNSLEGNDNEPVSSTLDLPERDKPASVGSSESLQPSSLFVNLEAEADDNVSRRRSHRPEVFCALSTEPMPSAVPTKYQKESHKSLPDPALRDFILSNTSQPSNVPKKRFSLPSSQDKSSVIFRPFSIRRTNSERASRTAVDISSTASQSRSDDNDNTTAIDRPRSAPIPELQPVEEAINSSTNRFLEVPQSPQSYSKTTSDVLREESVLPGDNSGTVPSASPTTIERDQRPHPVTVPKPSTPVNDDSTILARYAADDQAIQKNQHDDNIRIVSTSRSIAVQTEEPALADVDQGRGREYQEPGNEKKAGQVDARSEDYPRDENINVVGEQSVQPKESSVKSKGKGKSKGKAMEPPVRRGHQAHVPEPAQTARPITPISQVSPDPATIPLTPPQQLPIPSRGSSVGFHNRKGSGDELFNRDHDASTKKHRTMHDARKLLPRGDSTSIQDALLGNRDLESTLPRSRAGLSSRSGAKLHSYRSTGSLRTGRNLDLAIPEGLVLNHGTFVLPGRTTRGPVPILAEDTHPWSSLDTAIPPSVPRISRSREPSKPNNRSLFGFPSKRTRNHHSDLVPLITPGAPGILPATKNRSANAQSDPTAAQDQSMAASSSKQRTDLRLAKPNLNDRAKPTQDPEGTFGPPIGRAEKAASVASSMEAGCFGLPRGKQQQTSQSIARRLSQTLASHRNTERATYGDASSEESWSGIFNNINEFGRESAEFGANNGFFDPVPVETNTALKLNSVPHRTR